MAYAALLGSAPQPEVDALRSDSDAALSPSLLVAVSELITSIPVQPLGGLLGAALNGGKVLSPDLWHPRRPPVVHDPAAVGTLAAELTGAWDEQLRRQTLAEDDWHRVEIEKVIRVFQHASRRGEAVVSALSPPMDAERSARVRIPFPQ